MRYARLISFIPALILLAMSAPSQAALDVSVSVNIAPPVIPVYEQPPLPEPGYLWTPGYWAWDGMDYYWVPGTWVLPPESGLLWTPGYWAWNGGVYLWNAGYWAPEVGFYGGIDYGFGYSGRGYQGGYWHGGAFFYNRSVANFGTVNVVNVYTSPAPHWGSSHVSFNGGHGGVRARPTADEQRAMHDHHAAPTPMQRQHQEHAQALPTLHMAQNHGRPQILATQRPTDFGHSGAGLHNHAAAPNPGETMHGGQGPQFTHREPPARESMRGPARAQSDAPRQLSHEQSFHQTAPREVQQPREQAQPRERPQPYEPPREQPQRQPPQFHEAPQRQQPQFHEAPPAAREQAPPREGGRDQGRRDPQRNR